MESQPQNPDFRNNPENFHPCIPRKVRYKELPAIRCLFGPTMRSKNKNGFSQNSSY